MGTDLFPLAIDRAGNEFVSLKGKTMTGDASSIRDFHAHIYYDPAGVDRAKALAAEVKQRFGVAVGHSTCRRLARIRVDRAS